MLAEKQGYRNLIGMSLSDVIEQEGKPRDSGEGNAGCEYFVKSDAVGNIGWEETILLLLMVTTMSLIGFIERSGNHAQGGSGCIVQQIKDDDVDNFVKWVNSDCCT